MKLFPLVLLVVVSLRAGAADTASSDPRDQITELRQEISRHDERYHRDDAPVVSDAAYDQLKVRLALLEQAFPAAAHAAPALVPVGDDRSGRFSTHRHEEKMLSLDKAFTEADVRAFHARLVKLLGRSDLDYVVEPKFDGLAVSVTYLDGRFVRAVTRGNGVEGDDVTVNVRGISGLPLELHSTPGTVWPRRFEARGEVYVPFAEFERVNAEREQAGESRFANPRNLAAGTLRQQDPGAVIRRGLNVVFFGLGGCEPAAARPPSQRALHTAFEAWGLPGVAQVCPAQGPDGLVAAIDAVGRARPGFPFPTDGAVAKLNNVALQRELGESETAPRWALAYKFLPERVETEVRGIALQVGRTGVLTPVAELVPVSLAGSTVSRATLHNREEITRKDIRVGDFVYVEKAGDVVPAVVGVNLERRPASAQPYRFPVACPECYTALSRNEAEVAIRCPNQSCPAQVRRRIEHFVSKACLGIEGLGPATIEVLVGEGWVKDVPDLYRLNREDLLSLGRNRVKSVDRLLAAIEKSKRAELWRVIHGLGVPQLGAAAAKDLARQWGSLTALAESGPKVIPALGEPRYQGMMADLIRLGVGEAPAMAAPVQFAGKLFVFTGTLPTLTRSQATAKIEAAGGKVANTVSRNTDYLVAGAEPGAKLKQAGDLGVPVVDEAELLRMLSGPQ